MMNEQLNFINQTKIVLAPLLLSVTLYELTKINQIFLNLKKCFNNKLELTTKVSWSNVFHDFVFRRKEDLSLASFLSLVAAHKLTEFKAEGVQLEFHFIFVFVFFFCAKKSMFFVAITQPMNHFCFAECWGSIAKINAATFFSSSITRDSQMSDTLQHTRMK